MAWLIVPIAGVVLLYLAGLRRAALGLLVVAIVSSLVLYQYTQQVQQDATTRISESEVAVENVLIKLTFDSSYDISGRITNKSETYRLDGISFKVTLRDCQKKDKESRCVSMGEATTHVPITVPAQQARDFTGALYFGGEQMKPKGTLAWDYEITAIAAKRQ